MRWEACQTLNGSWGYDRDNLDWKSPELLVKMLVDSVSKDGDRLYLHLFSWPMKHVHLPGMADRIRYAQLLHDASEVKTSVVDPEQAAQNTTMGGLPAGTLTLHLPVQRPDVVVPVVEIFLG